MTAIAMSKATLGVNASSEAARTTSISWLTCASTVFSPPCDCTCCSVHRARVDVTDAPRAEDVSALEDAINEHNMAVTGRRDYRPLGVFDRDPRSGEVVAGLYGFTWGDWLEVKFVWVRPDHRGRGLARRLIEIAENEARARGCHSAWLDSYSFQAPALYEKLGYHAFGRLEHYPDAAERVFLTRSL